MATAIPVKMTASQYLDWEQEQVDKHEWHDGEVFAMAGGSTRHAALAVAVAAELRAELREGPCRVLSSDQKVVAHRPTTQHYVYPDVSVLCAPREVEPGTDVLTNPSILVEVLSTRTEQHDRGLKWSGYQRIVTLTDYLLVWQTEPRIEHFQRAGLETWSYRVAGPGDRVVLANGASIQVDAVFRGMFELDGD